jgi:hypothetical protein
MKINEVWHKANPMPKNPILEQRVAWHLEHREKCGCREIPDPILKEIKKRKSK